MENWKKSTEELSTTECARQLEIILGIEPVKISYRLDRENHYVGYYKNLEISIFKTFKGTWCWSIFKKSTFFTEKSRAGGGYEEHCLPCLQSAKQAVSDYLERYYK